MVGECFFLLQADPDSSLCDEPFLSLEPPDHRFGLHVQPRPARRPNGSLRLQFLNKHHDERHFFYHSPYNL
ncbi:unnamed protein product [Nesidiocoris tenuis]|uniref:Uncharacterized protein n=1 Tax=Nesidiocoris tenuis TaxID=355587 RepID=A0A6H5H4T2_9HEMI|nr:unnamed protein product [Nesidiocoris tenuis]